MKVVRIVVIVGACVVACRPISAADRTANRMAAVPGAPSPAATEPPPVDCAKAKCLALTFDDGPGPYTARLLDMLKERRVRATFFVLGRNGAALPGLLRREVAEHHEIGNHTYDHADLTTLSSAAIRREIRRTQQIIYRATGTRPTVMRPPYGATNRRVNRAVRLPEIMWRGDTLDWLHRNSGRVRRSVLKLATRNAVILVHDIHPTTVNAMPATLDALIRRGYTLVTVSQLYQGQHLRPGRAYAWS